MMPLVKLLVLTLIGMLILGHAYKYQSKVRAWNTNVTKLTNVLRD